MKINICIVGHGTWGKIILNNILLNKNYNLIMLVTSQKKIHSKLPKNTIVTKRYKDVIKYKNIKAAFIVTSPAKQIEISQFYLKNKISLLLEKPVALNLQNIKKIIELKNKFKKLILINYVYLYHPIIMYLKDLFSKNKEVVNFIKTKGGDNKPARSYIPTLFDWGPHDLSILMFFFKEFKLIDCLSEKKYRRINYILFLKHNDKNISSLTFGNNFNYKKRIIEIYTDKNVYNIDLVQNILLKGKKKISNFKIKTTPLQNMLNYFHKNFNNSKIYNRDLKDSILLTKILLEKKEKNI